MADTYKFVSDTKNNNKNNSLKMNIKDLINTAKAERNVQLKQIIYDCDCSNSHFHKVISGKRKPSQELIGKLSKALLVSESTLLNALDSSDKQPTESRQEHTDNNRQSNRWLKPQTLYVFLALALTVATIFFFYSYNKTSNNSRQSEYKNAIDKTKFIADVTIPDGTPIKTNTSFIKTWEIMNVGDTPWIDRSLKRVTPFSELLCDSAKVVKIKNTYPGESVKISVEFTTPNFPGTCRTDWKMIDNEGNFTFPELQGLYSIVVVINE